MAARGGLQRKTSGGAGKVPPEKNKKRGPARIRSNLI